MKRGYNQGGCISFFVLICVLVSAIVVVVAVVIKAQ